MENKYKSGQDLIKLAPEHIGDFSKASVDYDLKYDIKFANTFLKVHGTTGYLDNGTISDDDDLNELAELILKEAFMDGRMSENVTDIQIIEWSKVGAVRYKQGADWKYVRLLAKESVNPLATVFRKLSKVDISKSKEADITGSITRVYNGEEAVFRVAFSPNIRSQTVTTRVQDSKTLDMGLDDLGMPEEYVDIIKEKINLLNGLIILSGGKGEGKTTTLYAILLYLLKESKGTKNLMTLEDPVEYIVDGIVQSNVDNYTGYTFSKGVTVKFREAPDVTLLGEMNDEDTVYSAVDMGTGGNLTLSSLHANSTIDVVQTISNRSKGKVTLDMIGSSLKLLIHQALLKKLCPACKKSIPVLADESSWIEEKLRTSEYIGTQYVLGDEEHRKNCSICGGTGYKGRVLIVELLDASAKAFTSELFGSADNFDPFTVKENLINNAYSNYFPLERDVLRRFKDGDITLKQAKELIN